MLGFIIELLACVLVAMLTETTTIWSYVAPSNKIPTQMIWNVPCLSLNPLLPLPPFFSFARQNTVFVSWK